MIRESTKLIAKSLINYANISTDKMAIMDQVSGEYMFTMRRRPGCPLSEHDLKRKLTECLYAVVNDLGLESKKKRVIIDSAKKQSPETISAVLSHIIPK